MTDLVFLLLIFFIILSTMVTPPSLPVDLPNSSNISKEARSVSLTLFADGTTSVGKKIVPMSNLENELRSALSVKEEKSIMLHADKNTPTGTTVEVLDIAKKNNWKIALATKPK
ncbi:MAG: biopolymer transporter ExbD [Flavobacteriales bacterium]|nr:biopolymer transporter ExbD [Flavobacteriales bacterium]